MLDLMGWLDMPTAPRDGTAFIAFGVHSQSEGSGRIGHRAGDHWQAIVLWDIWREPHQFVFSKDGEPITRWGDPLLWTHLPAWPDRVRLVGVTEMVLKGERRR